jgi:hypothetical protein
MDGILAATQQGQDISDLRTRLVHTVTDIIGTTTPPQGRLPKPWWNDRIAKQRSLFHRAARQFNRDPSDRNKELKSMARRAFSTAIRQSKRRALVSAAKKVANKTAAVHILARGKKGPAHQQGVFHNFPQVVSHWEKVFQDPSRLPAFSHQQAPHGDGPRVLPDDEDGLFFSMISEGGSHGQADLFSAEDVITAVTDMKNRAPGDDGLRASVFHGEFTEPGQKGKIPAAQVYAPELARVFNHTSRHPLPEWMKTGTGHLLHKKGSRADVENYRMIVLQSLLAKTYEKLIDINIRKMVREGRVKLSKEQYGFQKYGSTYDAIFVLQSLVEGARQQKKPLYAAFLDLRKAFDWVSHRKLLRVLFRRGVPAQWIEVLRDLLSGRDVRIHETAIPTDKGTPQGSPLSPLLFILFIDPLVERLNKIPGVQLSTRQAVRCLLFADDLCLVAHSLDTLQRMIEVCRQWAEEAGMQFAATKSFLMHLAGPKLPDTVAVSLAGHELRWVGEFRYLGVVVKTTKCTTAKVPLEVTKMWAAFNNLRRVMDPRLPLPLHAQLSLFVTDIAAGPMYPAAVQDIDCQAIDVFVNKRLRAVTGCPPHTSATLLRCELGVVPSEYLAHRRQLQLWHHLHFETWFADDLRELVGSRPYLRMKAVAVRYGMPTLEDGPQQTWALLSEKGEKVMVDKDSWRRRVYETVTSSCFWYRFLQRTGHNLA